ncbi:MAG: glycosyltransferase [Nocardioidaceae bacterium]
MAQDSRVTAVVVTWNRRALLAESLRAIAAQTVPPQRIIVVDNASDDGTPDMLTADFPGVEVVTSTRNTGGAGGFALGLDRALAEACDAIWVMDDDTVPEPAALAELVKARATYPGEAPVVIASRVLWTDGRDHPMNTPRVKPGVRRAETAAAATAGGVPIRSASFVSVLLDAERVSQRGLPLADYFLWNDDFEFTTRLIRGGRAIYCPASVVIHKTKTFGSTEADPGQRFYYEVRNKTWLFTRSRGLNPIEKAAYAGSTARRWGRTIAGSADRRTLLRGLRDGIAEGLEIRAPTHVNPYRRSSQADKRCRAPRSAPRRPADRAPRSAPRRPADRTVQLVDERLER